MKQLIVLQPKHKKVLWVQEGCEQYALKLKPWMQVEFVQSRGASVERAHAQKKVTLEGEGILAALKPTDRVILLDERGHSMNSEKFAHFWERQIEGGSVRVAFVIGGAFGVSDSVRDRADHTVSIAPWVVSHQLVPLVLLEQVYRAFTILHGLPYHNGDISDP